MRKGVGSISRFCVLPGGGAHKLPADEFNRAPGPNSRGRTAVGGRSALSLPPGADVLARADGGRGARAQASRPRRHLHHRPQRQLHERLRGALQLLRVLPPVGSGDGYVLGFDEIFRKIEETIAVGGVQLLLQGGHNPDLPLAWYEDLFRAVKSRFPDFKLHALSPPEVIHLSRMSRLAVPEVIDRLIAAGLDSIPGGGAEILVDRVRKLLNCYGKASADEWLDVMRHAHRAGLRTTATMMYGTVETRRGAARAPAAAARAAGRDRRVHRVHHLELPARAHRARRRRSDRHRVPAHAGDRPARPRQLRQPAGVVGHAGRQGRAAEPRVRRQRHGQRDDRGERRPRGRRQLLHGRSRDRPQRRRRRVRRQAPQHALRHPRRSDLPRARGAADAGAGDRARRRRHSVPAELVKYPARSAAGKRAPQPPAPIAPPHEDRTGRPGSARWSGRRSATAGCSCATDRIERVGAPGQRPPAAEVHDLGPVAVLPGLVNAHTHLELSWLRGRVPPAATFIDWIKQLFVTRGGRSERAGDPRWSTPPWRPRARRERPARWPSATSATRWPRSAPFATPG